jgi:electron transfer flavoprotein beta subunit
MMLTIVVCAKQVVDPEAPLSLFRIAEDGKNLVPPPGTPPVISTFDENALEAALRIKDEVGAKVIVLSLGARLAKPVLKKTLAAGADELILLDDEGFADLDSNGAALALARAIQMIGDVDLVLCGRQAADTDAGQVGFGIAHILGLPVIILARKVQVEGAKLRVERVLPYGYEVVEAGLPALVTASNEIGELRFPPVKAVIAAQKVQPTVWTASELGLDFSGSRRADLENFFVPDRLVHCQMIEGDTAEQVAEGIAALLKGKVA